MQMIYADSPIDSSLFSLYLHQNFTQFCTDVDECDGVADWLSWADSSGGEAVSFFFLFVSNGVVTNNPERSGIKSIHTDSISSPSEHYIHFQLPSNGSAKKFINLNFSII